MKIYKMASKSEMEEFFNQRTSKHIKLVQKYCQKIADYDDRFLELIERGKLHDQSKYESPEKEPYVYITWNYKCKDEGIDFKMPEGMDDKMNRATEHHIKNKANSHHPEASCEEKIDLINRKDRDKPGKLIDATKMKDIDVGEMVSDWCAMSNEKGGNPKEWADKNVNIRWKFNDKQKELIYELIENVW